MPPADTINTPLLEVEELRTYFHTRAGVARAVDGVSFDLDDIEQPVVDLTPSPAVSSFIISDSDQFPGWKGGYLVGSLKARSLFRVEIENNQFVSQETLFDGIGRLRDIEQGVNGDIYLLFEHDAGGKIVRLVPVE